MKFLALALLCAASLAGCALPVARTYSLHYRDADGREIGTSLCLEAADAKLMRPPLSIRSPAVDAVAPPSFNSPEFEGINSGSEIRIDPSGAPFPLVVTRFPSAR